MFYLQSLCLINFYYLHQGERSKPSGYTVFVFSVRRSVVPSVYMMTHNSKDVIASTAQAATLAITFPFLCREAALPSLSPFLVAFLISFLPFEVTGEQI